MPPEPPAPRSLLMPRRPSAAPSFLGVDHSPGTGGLAVLPADPRGDCERDMDRRIAEVIRRGLLTRGAALALHGEVVETHPDDPCSAHQLLTRSLEELVPA
jgi:hypothetical protein